MLSIVVSGNRFHSLADKKEKERLPALVFTFGSFKLLFVESRVFTLCTLLKGKSNIFTISYNIVLVFCKTLLDNIISLVYNLGYIIL